MRIRAARTLLVYGISSAVLSVHASAGDPTGTPFDDVVVGTEDSDQILGLDGDDRLIGDPYASLIATPVDFPTHHVDNTAALYGALSPVSEEIALTGQTSTWADQPNTLFVINYSGDDLVPVTGIGAGAANLSSSAKNPVYSPDGKKIAFASNANVPALGLDNPNQFYQIVVRDLEAGTYLAVTKSNNDPAVLANGDCDYPSFSPDGKSLAFVCEATNLIDDDQNLDAMVPLSGWDTFVAHLDGSQPIVTASTDQNGGQIRGHRSRPSFSPDGTRILVNVAVQGALAPTILVRGIGGVVDGDRMTGPWIAGVGNAKAGRQPFAPDGRSIALATRSPGIDPLAIDTGSFQDAFIFAIEGGNMYGLAAGTGKLLSTSDPTLATANGDSSAPVFSPDGQKLAYYSAAQNLAGGAGGHVQLHVSEIKSGLTIIASITPSGTGGNEDCMLADEQLQFGDDGLSILFVSSATDLQPGDTVGTKDFFVAHLTAGAGADDLLLGGAGDDILEGGPGNDTAVYPGPRHRYAVLPDVDGKGSIGVKDLKSGVANQGLDTLIGVELLGFDDKTVPIADPGPGNGAPVVATSVSAIKIAKGASAGPFPIAITDPDGDTPFVSVSGASHGSVALNQSAGLFSYNHNGNSATSDSFVVNAQDDFNALGTATVTVSIGGALTGGSGDDQIFGGTDNDMISGGAGADTLSGGGGNDRIDGGSGADTMIGGPGDDTFVVDGPSDVVIELPGEGDDTIETSVSYALPNQVENLFLGGGGAISGTGNSLDNDIRGNAAANVIAGGSGDDTIEGGGGADVLDGGPGKDTLSFAHSKTGVKADLRKPLAKGASITSFENLLGSSKRDTLIGDKRRNAITGGRGADRLRGGKGRDTFIYLSVKDSPRKRPDVILDFSVKGGDRIDLRGIDARPKSKKRNAFRYIRSRPFTGKAGQLRFSRGVLEADTTGNGKPNLRIILRKVKRLSAKSILR